MLGTVYPEPPPNEGLRSGLTRRTPPGRRKFLQTATQLPRSSPPVECINQTSDFEQPAEGFMGYRLEGGGVCSRIRATDWGTCNPVHRDHYSRISSIREFISLANNTIYGLFCRSFRRSLSLVLSATRRLQVQ